MQDLSNINVVRSILERNGFHFSKALGQNFIIDPQLCPRIAENGVNMPELGVIEIGPGIGALTCELAKRAKKVVAVELDLRLIPLLSETLSDFSNVEIINADILKLDLRTLLAEKFLGMDVVVCANLPYYITSPVLITLLENRLSIKSITVMVQKEAAQRLCAPVGSREAGAITVAVNYYSVVKKLFDVPSCSFLPRPKVDSSVIRLDIRDKAPVALKDEKFFFNLVRAVFSQRRKTAANSIGSGLGIEKERIIAALSQMGLNETARAESFCLDQLANLANLLI